MTRNNFLGDEVKLQVSCLSKKVWKVASSLLAIVISAIPSKIAWILGVLISVLIFGYMYIRWKGLSFSGIMYVTKRDLDNGFSCIREEGNQVSISISNLDEHGTEGIAKLDGKMDEEIETSQSIRDEVTGVQVEVHGMISETRSTEERVLNMIERMDLMEENLDLMNSALMYLIESGVFEKEMLEFMEKCS